MLSALRVLIVDLNNFARYPTLAIGLLVAILRRAGMTVNVFSPLSCGVAGVARETRPGRLGLLRDRLSYRTAVSTNRLIRKTRAMLAAHSGSKLAQQTGPIAAAFRERLGEFNPDAVLVSTYLMYQPLCREIAAACTSAGVPCLLGGPYFYQPDVAREWIDIDGINGLVGGEVEAQLPEIISAMVDGDEDLSKFPGIWKRAADGQLRWTPPQPLHDLDALPFPDYSDFPWNTYPNRIVPLITGRGCGWGACSFCSDITSTTGRTYRSRSPQNVIDEIRHQHERHGARLFTFVDLKLNSNQAMWTALIDGFQKVAPGSQWIAAIHVDARQDDLSAETLRDAASAGMVRLTTGLESGSQRLLDKMTKGTDLSVTSRVLRDAAKAGISVRNTMILGYPGEEAEDVRASAKFVDEHHDCIERIMLNRFLIMTGTRLHRAIEESPERFPQVQRITNHHAIAQVHHHYAPSARREYRREVSGLLGAVHRINRRPLSERAREFEGVM